MSSEGRDEGLYQTRLDVAHDLLALNMDMELISKATALSAEEIEKLCG